MSPRASGTGDDIAIPFDDFVRAADIRSVLLGSTPDLPLEGLSADDFDSFAGRSDVRLPARSRWADPDGARLAVPDLVVQPQLIHPAFQALSPARRAAPPRTRAVVDCEATFGRSKLTDRWWVMGMGMAAAAILFSGMAVDFISREAVRRSRAAETPVSRVIPPAPENDRQTREERPEVIAAALPPEEEP